MEVKQILTVLWRWLWLIFLMAGAFGAIAFLREVNKPPMYSTSTTVLINQGRPSRQMSIDDLRPTETEVLVTTYMSLLNKQPVFEQVIANLNLDRSPRELAQHATIERVGETKLIELTVSDSDPNLAAAIANEIVLVFNQQEAALIANPYAANRPSLHVVEAAYPSTRPVNGVVPTTLILATLAGAMLAVGLGFVIEYFDERIRSTRDIAQLTGLPILATIPQLKGLNLRSKLVTKKDPHSAMAEGYRMLRAYFEIAHAEKPVHTLVVTSSNPQEGKSITAANLAVALAETGMRVVLVDADLRRPVLHSFFELDNTQGLTTLLAHPREHTIHQYILPTDVERLSLLPSGPNVSNPSSMLVPQTIGWLVTELATEFDIVIFDSPALLPVVDTRLLVRSCDAVLLVVKEGVTQAQELQDTHTYLLQSGTRMLGVVLNQVSPDRDRNAHYAHYHKRGWRKLYQQVQQRLRAPGSKKQPVSGWESLSERVDMTNSVQPHEPRGYSRPGD